jgi:integrase
MSAKNAKPRKTSKLSDEFIKALREFETYGTFYDRDVRGLRLRLGVHRSTWEYYRQYRKGGSKVKTLRKKLGHFPEMNTITARKEAEKEAGKFADGVVTPGKKEATLFSVAWDRYLAHLERKAIEKGKPPRWRDRAKRLGDKIIRPAFEKWTLIELSKNPAAIADFHAVTTKKNGPVSANHCARLIRACYRRETRLDRTLPPQLPTSAVDFNKEEASQDALDFKDFPKWRKAWDKIEDAPIRKAYHLFCLLSGVRPGEGARLRWSNVRDNEQSFTIPTAKAGKDIVLPASPEIMAVLRMAREATYDGHHEVKIADLVFPGCAQISAREALPARGNQLRHTYRTICADLEIDDLISHFLMGHAPAGINQRYVATLILQNGPAMRAAQDRISKRIVNLLGLTLGGHHDAPLVPRMPSRSRGPVAGGKSKAATPG